MDDYAKRIAEAVREAAATECNRTMMFPGGRQESYAHHGVDAAAEAIRSLDLDAIIASVPEMELVAVSVLQLGGVIKTYGIGARFHQEVQKDRVTIQLLKDVPAGVYLYAAPTEGKP
jgi:hypothetical protein